MFSRAEFRRFLRRLRRFEQQMVRAYGEILRDLEDEDLRETFRALRDAERRHDGIVKSLENLL